jgi:hypothetical protein
MTADEKVEFRCDVRQVKWEECLPTFAYGIRRYYIREDCHNPFGPYRQVLEKS